MVLNINLNSIKINFNTVTTVVFDVPVDESQMLGHMGSTQNMLEELTFASKTLYGAAVVGFLKKLLGKQMCFIKQKKNLKIKAIFARSQIRKSKAICGFPTRIQSKKSFLNWESTLIWSSPWFIT